MISHLHLSIKHLLVLLFGGMTLLAALPAYRYVDHIYAAQPNSTTLNCKRF